MPFAAFEFQPAGIIVAENNENSGNDAEFRQQGFPKLKNGRINLNKSKIS
jgi:hypothetical protein